MNTVDISTGPSETDVMLGARLISRFAERWHWAVRADLSFGGRLDRRDGLLGKRLRFFDDLRRGLALVLLAAAANRARAERHALAIEGRTPGGLENRLINAIQLARSRSAKSTGSSDSSRRFALIQIHVTQ